MKIRVIIWDAAQEARRSHTVDTANPVIADYVMEGNDMDQLWVFAKQVKNAYAGGQSVTTIPIGE